MDLNRLMRAKQAKAMERIEERRGRFLAGKLEAKEIDVAEWALITAMDEIERDE